MRTLIENKSRLEDLREQLDENEGEIVGLYLLNVEIIQEMDRLRQEIALEETRLQK